MLWSVFSRILELLKSFQSLSSHHGGAPGVTKLSKYYIKENDMPKKRLDVAQWNKKILRSIIFLEKNVKCKKNSINLYFLF